MSFPACSDDGNVFTAPSMPGDQNFRPGASGCLCTEIMILSHLHRDRNTANKPELENNELHPAPLNPLAQDTAGVTTGID
eukprot:3935313-Rhodomonas_salina.1